MALILMFGYKNTEFENYDIPNGAVMHEEEDHEIKVMKIITTKMSMKKIWDSLIILILL